MKLHHIGINVKNLQTSKEFYQTYFGYEEELKFRWGSENILFLRS
ncbi:VOC family protein [Bacillus sp. NTK074B]|nr:VOC family protein [Bacillus sp. NTK074B]